jgi:hypothetical protein
MSEEIVLRRGTLVRRQRLQPGEDTGCPMGQVRFLPQRLA